MSEASSSLLRNKGSDLFKNPLFSLSDLYEPRSIYEVFEYCKKIVLTNEVVSAIMHKLAESPVTDLIYEHDDDEVKKRLETFLESKLNIREHFLGLLFDLVTYSNAFTSFEVPVSRFLVSPNAGSDFKEKLGLFRDGKMADRDFDGYLAESASERNPKIPKRWRIETIQWTLTGNQQFEGLCPITNEKVRFERIDRFYPSEDNITLKRWDPNLIEINYNEITGKKKYYYRMSKASRELIRLGDRDMYNEVPWAYIEAVHQRRNVRISEENFKHLSNVRVSGAFNGWGVPRLYSAFRAIFYYTTLLRANQSIAVGKIHDLNILYPALSGSNIGIDPAAAIPGVDFARKIHGILKNHQKDPNYTGISPIPVGVTSVFGQGRMQLVSGEMEPVVRSITTVLGLPYDMLYGGGAYTGQAVGQRIWSAQTGLTRERFNEILNFYVARASAVLGTSNFPLNARAKLRPAESPDAVQEKSLIINMASNNMASRTSALAQVNLDWSEEVKKMQDEVVELGILRKLEGSNEAFMQARQQEILGRAQNRLMEESTEANAPTEAPQEEANQASMDGSPQEQAEIFARYIEEHPERAQHAMELARDEHPEAYNLLIRMQGEVPDMQAPSMDMSHSEPLRPSSLGRSSSTPPSLLPGRASL